MILKSIIEDFRLLTLDNIGQFDSFADTAAELHGHLSQLARRETESNAA